MFLSDDFGEMLVTEIECSLGKGAETWALPRRRTAASHLRESNTVIPSAPALDTGSDRKLNHLPKEGLDSWVRDQDP